MRQKNRFFAWKLKEEVEEEEEEEEEEEKTIEGGAGGDLERGREGRVEPG